jgi:hypothetical protein
VTPRFGISSVIPLIVLVLAACAHGDSYAPASFPSDSTFDGSARLTWGSGVDRDPVWMPGESLLMYSSDRLDRTDHDRCIVLLPPNGGRITRTVCNNAWRAGDSINTLDAPAPAADGRVALVRASRHIGSAFPQYQELATGGLDDIGSAKSLLSIPFTAGGVVHGGVSQVRWLGGDQLVYRADFAGTACITAGAPCVVAFIQSGLDLELHPASDSGPPSVIPGTQLASSVAADSSGDAIYYTLMNDNRVFRMVVSSGITSVFFSFPGGVVARDVQVAGGRLVAITGGSVSVLDSTLNPGDPPLQFDLGGDITVVELAGGTVIEVFPGSYRHPALAPSGHKVVAESGGDLWLFEIP